MSPIGCNTGFVAGRFESGRVRIVDDSLSSGTPIDDRTKRAAAKWQSFIDEWVSFPTDEHRAAITQALFQVSQQFEQEYSFTMNGNARYGRMEPVPDEEKEITLEAVVDGEIGNIFEDNGL